MNESIKTEYNWPVAASVALGSGDGADKFSDPNYPAADPAPNPGADYTGGNAPPQSQSDEQLLENYRRGDQESFRALVDRYQRELFHFLVRFLGNRALAEDTFQETFLQVHESAADFDIHRRLRPWLFTIAANKARDVLRARTRRPAGALQAAITPGDEENGRFVDLINSEIEMPGASMERAELAGRVRETIAEMPESLREILLLAYFSQFPYKQISDILGIPLGTVKSRLHTAVADFAIRWKKSNKEPHSS
ncbi:MAG TPA: RNA polymerase sigma factor [Tepidisphaeraceae bacterium]|nr:RNA polymerase sigma factor [Tepidisphaeraceae bacterium]